MADPVLYGYAVYKGNCAASQTVDLTNLLDESGANIGPALGGQFTTIHIFIASNVDRNPAATGYTAVMDAVANDTNDLMLWAGYKFQPSTPDTSITVTCGVSSGSSLIAIARVWDNVDPTTPMDVASVNNSGIDTAIPNPGSATPATTGAMFVFGSGCAHTDGAQTLSESYMDWSFADSRDGSFDLSVLVGHKAGGVASTPYDGAALTWSGTDANTFSHASNVMVLRPAPSGGDVAETVTATEVVSATLVAVGSVTDSASPAATEAATMFCPAGVTEAGTATETEVVVLVMSAAVTETASATESGDATVAAGGTGNVVEAATATEAQSATVIMGVSGVEATTATEAVAASNVMSVAVAETASSAATQAASAALSAGASETASATSTQAAGLLATGSATEAATATATESESLIYPVSVTEAATATALEAVIIPSAAEALFDIRGRWAIPSIAGEWHQPSITGAWAIPSIAGEWHQPSITGAWGIPSIAGEWKSV